MSRRRMGMGAAVAVGIAAAAGFTGCASAPERAAPESSSGTRTGVAGAGVSAAPADLVIRDVRLFDGEGVREGVTVVVRDGRIAEVIAGGTDVDARETVAGGGHTLMPGLIDAHTHTFAASALEASLAFGVTTVLDMFTSPETVRPWTSEQERGRATGRADIISAGILATAAGGHGTQYGMPIPTIESPADAESFVADRQAEGSSFIKIVVEDGSSYGREIPTLDAPRVEALVSAAHDRGLLAVAHVTRLRTARMVLEAGVDGLVHVWEDQTPSGAMVRRMVAAGTFVIPTLTVIESATGVAGGALLLEDARMDPLLDRDAVRSLGQSFPAGPGMVSSFDSALATVALLATGGVPILAGSDAPNPGTTHGASLHRELALLVSAGLSPVEALRAATSAPADAFGLDDRGRIRPGARADLVLVAGDPTVDILGTRAIARIWKGGVAYDRETYAARVAAARAELAAAESAPGPGPGLISDFDDGTMSAAFGAGWSETTDAMMGGKSTVDLAVESEGAGSAGTGMALKLAGETVAGVPFPWAGAMYFPGGQPMAPVNLAAAEGLSFRARGDGGTYQVLLFHEAGGMAPIPVAFVAGAEWAEHVIPWAEFQGATGRGVMGIAFVAGGEARPFELRLDDVALR